MWMVRCDGGQLADQFFEQGVVAVGWGEVGNLSGLTREQVIQKVQATWPDHKFRKAVMIGSMLHKLASVFKKGDQVVTYDPSKRTYSVGHIVGEYMYSPHAENGAAHRRDVNWENNIDRDSLSVPTKNNLGSTLTIFEITGQAENEFKSLINGKPTILSAQNKFVAEEPEMDTKDLLEDYQSKAREFTKDKIMALDWDEMQELVAGALRAMGYKTRISPQGSDRGKDIVASPDGLGLEQPRIVVEVKHRANQQMGSPEIRSFLGGRHKDDKGLYVSTGGFSKDAKYEADRASIPLTLMDIDDLVDLVIENYEKMDMETRTLLPLTKIFWPS